jgi:choline dehydrogenase-like flavoprotein
MDKIHLECECLVIGSGPGGAITASILALSGHNVLVLEEGRDESGPFSFYSLKEMDRYRHGGVSVTRGTPKVFYLEGCCLGGASEINAGLYHRPPEALFDQWAKGYGLKNFRSKDLAAFFEMNEKDLEVGAVPCGHGPGSGLIECGSRVLGWKSVRLARLWEYSVKNPQGQRRSMSRSFIPQAQKAGAKFLLGTKVKKINFRSARAFEALCVSPQENRATTVRFKTVFVCAGAIQTPLLLRQSGLRHNIGDRLKTHLSARLLACFDGKASDPAEGVPSVQVSEFKPQLTLGGSYSSPAFLASWLADRPDFAGLMQSPSNLGIFYASVMAKSQGRVRPDLFSGEAVLSMDVNKDDLLSLGDGLYKLGQMLFAAGAAVVYSPLPGRKDFRAPEDLRPLRNDPLDYGVDLSTMHLFSSCPMGEDMSLCALDSFGRVHGQNNIYVNDASMLPDAPGTNPQALIMAIARRNILNWLENKKRRDV